MSAGDKRETIPVQFAAVVIDVVLETPENKAFLIVEWVPKDKIEESDYTVILEVEAGEWDVHLYLTDEQRKKLIEQLTSREGKQ